MLSLKSSPKRDSTLLGNCALLSKWNVRISWLRCYSIREQVWQLHHLLEYTLSGIITSRVGHKEQEIYDEEKAEFIYLFSHAQMKNDSKEKMRSICLFCMKMKIFFHFILILFMDGVVYRLYRGTCFYLNGLKAKKRKFSFHLLPSSFIQIASNKRVQLEVYPRLSAGSSKYVWTYASPREWGGKRNGRLFFCSI